MFVRLDNTVGIESVLNRRGKALEVWKRGNAVAFDNCNLYRGRRKLPMPHLRYNRASPDRLQLSSPEFYAACSASPPPPLSLVFGSGALKSQEELFSRLHQQREAAGRSAARAVQTPGTGEEIKRGSLGGSDGKQLLKKREEMYLQRLEVSGQCL